MKRKIEHMPNITVIGNASTLYSTTHTKMFRGMRKKFMMVLLASSGMYWDLIFIMDGQNMPTQLSKVQKPRS
jgi:site-specific recombinase XerD